jgi:uncharacterized protein YxeA
MKKIVLIILVTIAMFFIGMCFGYNRAIKQAEPFVENGMQFIDFNGNVHQYDFINIIKE